jgi:DNA-directed RNA polymerase specialized sigma24 family protein
MVNIPDSVKKAHALRREADKVFQAESVKEVDKLKRATKRLAAAQQDWEEAVFKLQVYGVSHRTIAAIAGCSHQTVANVSKKLSGDDERTCG